MSQPQCIIRQRKTLQNAAAGAEASENTIGGWVVKDRKSSTITLLLENRKPLRQPNLIQPPPLSAPCRPPNHHHPAPKHADKTSDTAPLSSFNPLPPPTACLLGAHVYILLPTTPLLCQCALLKPAQKRCMGISRQKRLLPPPLWSPSSPTFNFSSSSMEDIPPNWYCNLWR